MKWEYKVCQFKDQKHFNEELHGLGEEGWELTESQDINGWVVVYFKRPSGDALFDGNSMDTLTGLINLLNDDKKTLKLINDLKSAYSSHKDGLDKLITLRDDLDIKASEVTQLNLETQKSLDALDDEKAKIAAKKAELDSQIDEFNQKVSTFNQSLKDYEKQIKEDKKALEDVAGANQARLAALEDELNKREAALKNKADGLALREDRLSKREAEHAEILKHTQELSARLSRN